MRKSCTRRGEKEQKEDGEEVYWEEGIKVTEKARGCSRCLFCSQVLEEAVDVRRRNGKERRFTGQSGFRISFVRLSILILAIKTSSHVFLGLSLLRLLSS